MIPGASQHLETSEGKKKKNSKENHEGAASKKKARNIVTLKPKKKVFSVMETYSTNVSFNQNTYIIKKQRLLVCFKV